MDGVKEILSWKYKTFTLDELLPSIDNEQEIIELASKEIKEQLDKENERES